MPHTAEDVATGAEEKFRGGGPPPPPEEPPGGGRNGGEEMPAPGGPMIANAQLGMLIFIGAELMFFAGLIAAFLFFRFSGLPWPPPGQPRLPVGVTAINTVFLIASSFTFIQARRGLRRGDTGRFTSFLSLTGALGVLFLGIQGYEWLRLLGFGLSGSSGVYASIFYTLIGAHALHVTGAVLWLGVILLRARLGYYSPEKCEGVALCGMYWHMVVGLWPVLFYTVYLL